MEQATQNRFHLFSSHGLLLHLLGRGKSCSFFFYLSLASVLHKKLNAFTAVCMRFIFAVSSVKVTFGSEVHGKQYFSACTFFPLCYTLHHTSGLCLTRSLQFDCMSLLKFRFAGKVLFVQANGQVFISFSFLFFFFYCFSLVLQHILF